MGTQGKGIPRCISSDGTPLLRWPFSNAHSLLKRAIAPVPFALRFFFPLFFPFSVFSSSSSLDHFHFHLLLSPCSSFSALLRLIICKAPTHVVEGLAHARRMGHFGVQTKRPERPAGSPARRRGLRAGRRGARPNDQRCRVRRRSGDASGGRRPFSWWLRHRRDRFRKPCPRVILRQRPRARRQWRPRGTCLCSFSRAVGRTNLRLQECARYHLLECDGTQRRASPSALWSWAPMRSRVRSGPRCGRADAGREPAEDANAPASSEREGRDGGIRGRDGGIAAMDTARQRALGRSRRCVLSGVFIESLAPVRSAVCVRVAPPPPPLPPSHSFDFS